MVFAIITLVMKKIQDYLFENKDLGYRDFTLPLVPNLDPDTFIGVRLPIIKKYAKSLDKAEIEDFLKELPHRYHEENLLHAFILSDIKDYASSIRQINDFLPFVENWSVCDAICNKHLAKHKDELIVEVYKWISSSEVYKVRYGVKCLMNYYLGEDFRQEHIEKVKEVRLDDYYVKMMVAWYLATGLAKNYDDFVSALEKKEFDRFTHNKAIQKAVESYRVSEEHKSYLKTLKMK